MKAQTVAYLHEEWAPAEATYQLGDVGHLSHVVQGVFSGFVQHNEAGGHGGQVPQRRHTGVDASVAVCHLESHQGVTDFVKQCPASSTA